ncbi:MIP/aquaporin family protein [Streptococcus caprae]|uniref:MIP/aquaporin family protein n=1 Tax=Streptococcus caprae TaxID=1640501 RepID=A0ABV8CWS1_9STRE
MNYSWAVKYISEFFATAIFVLIGNGVIANVRLKGTKMTNAGWPVIAVGYGLALLVVSVMFGNVSGAHVNPAVTIGLAASGHFSWAHVLPYLVAQFFGAFFGQILLVAIYNTFFLNSRNPANILSAFATVPTLDQQKRQSRGPILVATSTAEFIGTFVFVFGVLALTTHYFGAERVQTIVNQYKGTYTTAQAFATISDVLSASISLTYLTRGFLYGGLILALGGVSGGAFNPVRDLSPRLLHHILPKSILGTGKGSSRWWYAWVPALIPILGALAAAGLYIILYR